MALCALFRNAKGFVDVPLKAQLYKCKANYSFAMNTTDNRENKKAAHRCVTYLTQMFFTLGRRLIILMEGHETATNEPSSAS